MSVFEYKGINQAGNSLRGKIEADTLKSAREKLKNQGIYLQEIHSELRQKIKKSSFQSKKVSIKELALFTKLLASLLRSGVPLVDALQSISEQLVHPHLSRAITHIKNQVNEGKSFHLSLKEHPSIFDNIYVSLCESGEASGTLDDILEKLAQLMEKRSGIKNKVLQALFYPGMLMTIAIGMMIFLCTYVLPGIMDLFENTEQLPFITRLTLGFSNFLIDYWISLIVGVIVLIFLFLKWKKTENGKKQWDSFVLRVPVFGRIARSADIAMFSRTLSTLLKGGVPILKSMDIVKNVVSNELIKEALEQAKLNVKEGEALVKPLEASGQFPPVVLQMIRVGENTGELESMLEQISKSYEAQVELETSALTALLSPIMILVMAGIVVFILLSALLPMISNFDSF